VTAVPAPTTVSLAAWLRCPVCALDLEASDRRVIGCANGHRFDVNKRGFVSLVSSKRRIAGDGPTLLDARTRFLERGHYFPIAGLVARTIPASAMAVVDSGCGTGYYLREAIATRPDLRALALDVSPSAVSRAMANSRIDGLVADVWGPVPVRSGIVDTILCVFAPRNPSEFARMLRGGGGVIVVTPREDHLREIRAKGSLLKIEEDKLERLDHAFGDDFRLTNRERLTYSVQLSEHEQNLAATMGPAGHHDASRPILGDEPVTVSVDVSVFERL
jgi:23S rRNA (guanine745-N1)-methyltransferase